jgi:hypothetical protein
MVGGGTAATVSVADELTEPAAPIDLAIPTAARYTLSAVSAGSMCVDRPSRTRARPKV